MGTVWQRYVSNTHSNLKFTLPKEYPKYNSSTCSRFGIGPTYDVIARLETRPPAG